MVINDWLSTNVDSGEGNKKVTLTSTPNNTDEDRVTTLIVKGKNKSVSVNVRQLKQSVSEGFVFYVKNYSIIPVSGTNADRILSVFSCNKPCTLIRYDIYTGQDLGMDFVTEETLEMAEGINNIYLNAESNIVGEVTNPVRFVSYEIVYEGKAYGYFNIFQQGSTPTFTVTPNEVKFNEMGGTKTIEITANTNWRIGGNNFRPQITFSKTFGKSGTHTISVTAQEYEGVEDLIYNLWVGVESDISVPLVIKQSIVGISQNCFYVEPTTNESVVVKLDFIAFNNISASNNYAQYYNKGDNIFYLNDNDEWVELTLYDSITISKRTYFKNYSRWLDGYTANNIYSYVSSYLNIKGLCNVGGDLGNLIRSVPYRGLYAVARKLFYNSDIVDASMLILETRLLDSCYSGMFSECTSLVNAPALPATTLSENCYYGMFQGCTSLVNAPALPATTLAEDCYYGMFENCTSLTTAPELPATTLATFCYGYMFYGCTSLTTAPQLPATTLVDWCYSRMFKGCSNLNYIKMLATTLYGVEGDDDFSLREWVDGVAEYGTFVKHPDMDSLTKGINGIPTLWNVEDDERYLDFSIDIDSINMIDIATITINVTSKTNWSVEYNSDWFSVSPTIGNGDGSITITANAYNDVDREANIYFYINGEIVNSVRVYQVYVEMPTDVENCFYIEPLTEDGTKVIIPQYSHFRGVYYYDGFWDTLMGDTPLIITKRTYFKGLNRNGIITPLTIKGLCKVGGNIETLLGEMKDNYAYCLFEYSDIVDASNLILPTTTSYDCYAFMFYGCKSLVATPALPATTLAKSCYLSMFHICTSLTTAPALPATTLANGCYANMFQGCKSLVATPALPATTLVPECYNSMFQGCSNLNNITMLATDTSAEDCLFAWIGGVSPTGIFYKNPNMNDLPTGINGIPEGWEVRDYENNI